MTVSGSPARPLGALMFAALLLAACSGGDDPAAADDDWVRGEVLLADDFDGDRLDPDWWGTCHWWATEAGCTITGTGELQVYRPANVTVEDGRVLLTARPQRTDGPDDRTFDYTSGMISTGPPDHESSARFAFTYGEVEWVAWSVEGQGLWPALWLLPADKESKPEIDIVELYGHVPDLVRMRLHHLVDGVEVVPGERFEADGLAEGWHTYGLRWAPGRLDYLVDGVVRWRVRGPEVPAEPMYLIANLAVGGDSPGAPDASTPFPASFAIDRVRVWGQA